MRARFVSDGYCKVANGAYCEVWLHNSVVKEIKHAPAKDRAKAGEIIERLSEDGYADFPETAFKFEGRFKAGHKKIAVHAVKAWQIRILGGWCEGNPRRFVCPEAAIKKRNEADRRQLERVAEKVGEYCGS